MSQKLKLLGNSEFNHLTIILIYSFKIRQIFVHLYCSSIVEKKVKINEYVADDKYKLTAITHTQESLISYGYNMGFNNLDVCKIFQQSSNLPHVTENNYTL